MPRRGRPWASRTTWSRRARDWPRAWSWRGGSPAIPPPPTLRGCRCRPELRNSIGAAPTEPRGRRGAAPCLSTGAGRGRPKGFLGGEGARPFADFERVITINLIGTFNMMRLAAADMTALEPLGDGERGIIVSTASVAAFEGQVGQAAYAASKGGVAALTMPAARELAQFGIRVMAVAPGIFATPMLRALPDEWQSTLAASVPFPNWLGRPEQFADLVLHCVRNLYLNGEVIRLDGALRMAPRGE